MVELLIQDFSPIIEIFIFCMAYSSIFFYYVKWLGLLQISYPGESKVKLLMLKMSFFHKNVNESLIKERAKKHKSTIILKFKFMSFVA